MTDEAIATARADIEATGDLLERALKEEIASACSDVRPVMGVGVRDDHRERLHFDSRLRLKDSAYE